MACKNCNKSVIDPNLRSTISNTGCDCEVHTESDSPEKLVLDETRLSRRVDSNRAMVVSVNGKSIMAIVDRFIEYTRCLIRNIITHVVNLDKRVTRLEGNGGDLTPVKKEFDAGYMYNWTMYRIGNTVFVAAEGRQIATSPANQEWTLMPNKVPEGFRPIQSCQVLSFAQTKAQTTVQRQILPDGVIHYLSINGIEANTWVITPSTSWLTNDKYPTIN
ncbi:hypothetical protein [Lactococcus phage PMBT68]|nr:hypothetical protein [Lactococcus phage P1411]